MKSAIKLILHIITLVAILIICQALPTIGCSLIPSRRLGLILNLIIPIILITIASFCYVKLFWKKDWDYFRIVKPKADILLWLLLGCSLIVFISFLFVFFKYAMVCKGRYDIINLILQCLVIGIMAGVCEEIIFRGFMFKIIEEKLNTVAAFFIPAILFSSLHILNDIYMGLLSAVQLIVGGTLAGLMFAMISYKKGSVFYAVAMHTGWNCTYYLFKFGHFEDYNYNSLLNFKFETHKQLINGGDFGIEVSFFAIIVYVLVIFFTAKFADKVK